VGSASSCSWTRQILWRARRQPSAAVHVPCGAKCGGRTSAFLDSASSSLWCGCLALPHYSVPDLDMCVLSGDPLADYGPILWRRAALWSQVKHAILAPHVYINLISRTFIPFRPHAKSCPCFFPYIHMRSCLQLRPLSFSSCCGALSAKLSKESDP
jgi:hypothetical protein